LETKCSVRGEISAQLWPQFHHGSFSLFGSLSPRFDVPNDCSVELSPLGNQFFTDIFEAYDRDQDGALSQNELNDLFSTSPGNPWIPQGFPDTTITDDTGKVTLQGWLAQWR
jgi:Ras family protein T1